MNRDAKHGGDTVHRVTHTPGTRAAREHKHARTTHDRGLISNWRLHCKLVARLDNVLPNRFHMQSVCSNTVVMDDWRLYGPCMLDRPRGSRACRRSIWLVIDNVEVV